MIIHEIREGEPDFQISDFLQHIGHDIAQTILTAYVHGRCVELSTHCTQNAYSIISPSILSRDVDGIVMDTNILHISEVERTTDCLLEDLAVLLVTLNDQQINLLTRQGG